MYARLAPVVLRPDKASGTHGWLGLGCRLHAVGVTCTNLQQQHSSSGAPPIYDRLSAHSTDTPHQFHVTSWRHACAASRPAAVPCMHFDSLARHNVICSPCGTTKELRRRLHCCHCTARAAGHGLQPPPTCGLTTRHGQLTRWMTESVMLPIMAFFIALRPREAGCMQ
jgi:hypothetical protein